MKLKLHYFIMDQQLKINYVRGCKNIKGIIDNMLTKKVINIQQVFNCLSNSDQIMLKQYQFKYVMLIQKMNCYKLKNNIYNKIIVLINVYQ